MAELSKFFKIVLVIDIIAAFIYGILYLFIPGRYAVLIFSPYFSLHFWHLWGLTCLILGIMGMVGFMRIEWTAIKIFMEFVMMW
jgi:hypothetical protein